MKRFSRINRYPDGQVNVELENVKPGFHFAYGEYIKTPLRNYEDLFVMKSWAEALRANCVARMPDIVIPCLLGQRADRRFKPNQAFDLKIIADFINSCNFSRVGIFDPHSDVSLALINNSFKLSPREYIFKSIDCMRTMFSLHDPMTLVSPDAGAYKKVYELAEDLGLPLVGALKHRDLDGNIDLRFNTPVAGRHCLIVDDLADGGYTFHLLAESLKQRGAKTVCLYVSHGFFHKGFELLSKNIDHIFTTDSAAVHENSIVTTFKIH